MGLVRISGPFEWDFRSRERPNNLPVVTTNHYSERDREATGMTSQNRITYAPRDELEEGNAQRQWANFSNTI